MTENTVCAPEPTIKKLSLHEMRKESGVSGSAVARLCNITYRSLRNWETGTAVPNIVNIHDLLQIYGYSFYELDLEPFYALLQDRSNKQRELDGLTDNPLRERRLYEQEAGEDDTIIVAESESAGPNHS